MGTLLVRWIVLVVSLIAAAFLTNAMGLGFSVDTSSGAAVARLFIGVLVLALLNATLGNALKLLTLPLNCLTLGLASLVINAAMLIIVSNLGFGFQVSGFLAALVGSLILSAINGLLGSTVLRDERE